MDFHGSGGLVGSLSCKRADKPNGIQIQQMNVTATALEARGRQRENVMRKKSGVQSLAHMQVTLTYVKFYFVYACMKVFLRKESLEIIKYSKIPINYQLFGHIYLVHHPLPTLFQFQHRQKNSKMFFSCTVNSFCFTIFTTQSWPL